MPAGDIGVGGREIGYLFGQYKRLRNEFTGVLTGKGLNWGGSLIRPEATGYGCVYFAAGDAGDARARRSRARPASSRAAATWRSTRSRSSSTSARKPVTLSDSDGYIYDEAGIDREKLAFVMELKNVRRGRIKEYADKFKGAVYTPVDAKADHNPLWDHQGRLRVPERDPERDQRQGRGEPAEERRLRWWPRARTCPPTSTASTQFLDARILYGPGKAANAGGVAVSGLEMAQNSMRSRWTREEVDERLQHHHEEHPPGLRRDAPSASARPGNYVNGANIAGFLKVADAMMDQGLV